MPSLALRSTAGALSRHLARHVPPVGLAAGVDRTGEDLERREPERFAAVEIGTVRPDVGRDVEDRLRAWRERWGWASAPFAVGVNLGPTPEADAASAGRQCALLAAWCAPWADYVVLNLTAEVPALSGIGPCCVGEWVTRMHAALGPKARRVPLLAKLHSHGGPIAPGDLRVLGFRGAVVVEPDGTTPEMPGRAGVEPGLLYVSVGGVTSLAEAHRRWAGGADLVQVHRAYEACGGLDWLGATRSSPEDHR